LASKHIKNTIGVSLVL